MSADREILCFSCRKKRDCPDAKLWAMSKCSAYVNMNDNLAVQDHDFLSEKKIELKSDLTADDISISFSLFRIVEQEIKAMQRWGVDYCMEQGSTKFNGKTYRYELKISLLGKSGAREEKE